MAGAAPMESKPRSLGAGASAAGGKPNATTTVASTPHKSAGMSAAAIFQRAKLLPSLGFAPQMLIYGALERLARGYEIYDTGETGPGGCTSYAPSNN